MEYELCVLSPLIHPCQHEWQRSHFSLSDNVQFWDHYFDWKILQFGIKELIDVRKRNDIRANSKLDILTAEQDLYVARIDDRLLVKIGPRLEIGHLAPPLNEWNVASLGDGYIVWEKKSK